MKPAFSTVACPDWTLGRVVEAARGLRYDGVELRTLGFGSTTVSCDPLLTDANKIDTLFDGSGVTPVSISTSLRFDDPINPPVIGRLLRDFAKPVRMCKRIVRHASAAEIPFVRVFGFELASKTDRRSAVRHISERLRMATEGCHKTGVRLLIESGGSFCRAEQLAELIRTSDWDGALCASYNVPISRAGGCSLESALDVLGGKMEVVKVKDLRDGEPCMPGEGTTGLRESLEILRDRGFGGWVVYEHDRMWRSGAAEPMAVIERFRELFADVCGGSANAGSSGARAMAHA